MALNYVTKRDGSTEPFQVEKISKWAKWASNTNVSWGDIVINTLPKLYDGISTSKIQLFMIDECLLFKNSEYSAIAAKLLAGLIYSEVGISIKQPPDFFDRYSFLTKNKYWGFNNYSDSDIRYFAREIDYNYDINDTNYVGLRQWYDKYALRNVNANIIELPQETIMGMAMALFEYDSDIENRNQYVVNFYNHLKHGYVNIATPFWQSSRTGEKSGASCVVISSNDTAPSILTATSIAYTMTSKRAGIGIEYNIRSEGDIVGNNKCKHKGKIPTYELLLKAIKSVSQGKRGGAGTVTFTCLDPEIFNLLELKSQFAPEFRRIRLLDYTLAWNDVFLECVDKNLDWVLISKKDAPELYDNFYNSRDSIFVFTLMLNKYIRDVKKGLIKGRVVKARDVMKHYIKFRYATGRDYAINVTEVNTHTPFKETIFTSNLCLEIALPTRGYNNLDELYQPFNSDTGLTSLCFLMAIDVGKLYDTNMMCDDNLYQSISYHILRALDNIIENLDYPYKNIETSSKYYRNVGVGITNLAYCLAKNKVKYTSYEGKEFVHKISENHLYNLLFASTRLAGELGACGNFNNTKYAYGELPIDTKNSTIYKIHPFKYYKDWGKLRDLILLKKLRFSVTTTHPPTESSSLRGGGTNGVYAARDGIVFKKRNEGNLLFIVPEWELLKDYYQFAWDIPTKDMSEIYAIIQLFTEQSISADFYEDFTKLDKPQQSMDKIINDTLYASKLGLKTFYYLNIKQPQKQDILEVNNATFESYFKNINDQAGIKVDSTIDDDDDISDCSSCKL